MKSISSTKLAALFSFFFCQYIHAQIPDGGISLTKETGVYYSKSGKGTLTNITIADQSFTSGFRLTTGADINNTWDSQIQFSKVAGIDVNDVLLITFYARTISSLQESGDGAVIACIEENKDPYTKQIYQKVAIGRDWKQYFVPLKSNATLPATGVTYSLHTGFASQTIEVAAVKFLNYKNTVAFENLPVTEITYYGREVDAAWRAEADARINQYRKGIADITVYDETGQVVKDAAVSVEMIRHKFGFGSAIAASRFISDAVYRTKVYELFNEVVLENDLKWPSFNPSPSVNTTRTLDSLAYHHIPVRGHNLVWPNWNYNLASLKTLSNDPVAFRNEIDRHIDQATNYTKGKVVDWDVLNEPVTNTQFQDILGNEVMADWFKRVRINDRQVKLYINDYSILSAGGMDINHQNGYFDVIEYIDGLGGKIQGLGMQGHFGSDLTPITKVYSILERFASLGKEIKITEHDINIKQRAVQADYTRDFMTIVFSHPSVKSFLFWGFWESQHWIPDGALYNADWTIRPNGQAYLDLVFDKWWTKKTDLNTDSAGKTSVDGFLGTYKYTIKSGDLERTGTFSIENSNASGLPNQIVLSFDQTIPDNFAVTASQPTCLCEGETVTLQTNSGTDSQTEWYRDGELLAETSSTLVAGQAGSYMAKYKKGGVEISSAPVEVAVNQIPEAVITTSGDLTFCPGEKVTFTANTSPDLTYNWYKSSAKIQGSVTSIDISEGGSYSLVTNANGCSKKSTSVLVRVLSSGDPSCTTGLNRQEDAIRVFPNPFQNTVQIEASGLIGKPVVAELFNATGATVYRYRNDHFSGNATLTGLPPGFYTLIINDGHTLTTSKLIGY